MNPFELHGFAFLTFYLVLGIGGVMLLRWYMNRDDDDARRRSAARENEPDSATSMKAIRDWVSMNYSNMEWSI